MAFFSHQTQIYIFPSIFPVSVHFPLFRENYYFPTTLKNVPSEKNHLLFTYFMCIFPLLWPWCIYASPNARTGRPWRFSTIFIFINTIAKITLKIIFFSKHWNSWKFCFYCSIFNDVNLIAPMMHAMWDCSMNYSKQSV